MIAGSRSAGFSLVELMVAMAIAGMMLVSARIMLEQLADGADGVIAARSRAERRANAERLLYELVGRTESAGAVPKAVTGDDSYSTIATWCDSPGGWLEACTISLHIMKRDSLDALVLVMQGDTVEIKEARRLRILYLADARNGGTWLQAWSSVITTPAAIGIATDEDTSIVRIGERG